MTEVSTIIIVLILGKQNTKEYITYHQAQNMYSY